MSLIEDIVGWVVAIIIGAVITMCVLGEGGPESPTNERKRIYKAAEQKRRNMYNLV